MRAEEVFMGETFLGVWHADNTAFCYAMVGGYYFFDAARAQSVSGDVDDII